MTNSSNFESESEDVEDRSQGTTETKKSDEQDDIKQQLTRGGETRNVLRLKVTALLVMILAGVGISVTVFKLTRDAQLYEFKIQYEGSAEVRFGQEGSSSSSTTTTSVRRKNLISFGNVRGGVDGTCTVLASLWLTQSFSRFNNNSAFSVTENSRFLQSHLFGNGID
jgi:hypothetical protein